MGGAKGTGGGFSQTSTEFNRLVGQLGGVSRAIKLATSTEIRQGYMQKRESILKQIAILKSKEQGA